MKKFNHGDWFSLHKMTENQKQWCLDNLDWLTEDGKIQCLNREGVIALYLEGSYKFLSSSGHVDPLKELKFENLYYEKEEPKPMNLEKYSIEDLRRIRSNIDWILEAVDAFNNQTEAQESEESVRGFEGLELTEEGEDLFRNTSLQFSTLFFESEHSEDQTNYMVTIFPLLEVVEEGDEIAAIFSLKKGNHTKKVHFNDLFRYETEE